MTYPFASAASIRRPAILIRAAVAGAGTYQRGRDLQRALRCPKSQRADIVAKLVEEEARIEELRVAGDPVYRVSRHVLVLSALVAELTGRGEKAELKESAGQTAAETMEAKPVRAGRPRAERKPAQPVEAPRYLPGFAIAA